MKNKKRLKRILSGVLGTCFACISFMATGCMPMLLGGNWLEDLDDQLSRGEITQEEYDELFKEYSGGVELSGIKVLRRPSQYDYDDNNYEYNETTGQWEKKENADYYQSFSENIFLNLYAIYGILNNGYHESDLAPGSDIFDALYNVCPNTGTETLRGLYDTDRTDSTTVTTDDSLKYFYDAIRYQIIKEEPVDSNTDGTIDYYEVTADTSKAWNWVQNYEAFRYDKDGIRALIYADSKSIDPTGEGWGDVAYIDNGKLTNYFEDFNLDLFSKRDEGYYSNIIDLGTYSNTFSTLSADGNSDFINTLTYAIYNIVLGLDIADAGWQGTGDNNKWIVEGYEDYSANGYSSSSEYAMKTAKTKFEKLGSYVGLTTKNKEKIAEYIVQNVIGENALNYGLQDLYYEDIVNAVVTYCGKLTTTGSEGGRSSVGDTFIASEIVDYPSTSFFLSSNEEDEFEFIKSYEYQSIILMPKNPITKLTDIWLDFKYEAKNKNGDPIDDDSISITIEVDIRWYDGTTLHTLSSLGNSQRITVYNGVVDVGESNTTMQFELDSDEGFGADSEINIGKFVCDDLDPEKVFEEKSITTPTAIPEVDDLTGFKKITLNGNTTARHYYEVVNSGTFGAYGVLKSDKLKEAGVESYLEIAFDIKKEIGNLDKNYDFYVGFAQLHCDDTDTSWVQ